MKLKLKNVGRFYKEAEIDINGITVLAGENGTGKSTIGKALFCIFNSFHDYEDQIIQARHISIFRLVRMYAGAPSILRRNMSTIDAGIQEVINEYDLNKDISSVSNKLAELLEVEINNMPEEFISRVEESLSTSKKEILNAVVKRSIEEEFNSELGHVNYPDDNSTIEICIKGMKIKIEEMHTGEIVVHDKFSLVKEIVYIDDPCILDSLGSFYRGGYPSHKNSLAQKLVSSKKEGLSAVDDVLTQKKMEQLNSILDTVCSGKLMVNKGEGFSYADAELKHSISMSNVSTGLKSFVILKTLLEKEFLENNGIVVLDEPEIHLHPEWMRIYAEVIVLLHNTFNINFVISTHSADFLSFIELYSKKYEVDEKCKYYMLFKSKDNNLTSEIKDVTYNIEEVYSKLAKPFLAATEEMELLNEKIENI